MSAHSRSQVSLVNPKSITKYYLATMSSVTFVAFWLVLLIPFWYDQSNVKDFQEATKNNSLLIREYSDILLNAQLHDALGTSANAKSTEDFIDNRKLISLDYVQQMRKAQTIKMSTFVMGGVIVSFFLTLFFTVIAKRAKRHRWRTSLMIAFFCIALFAIQFVGLPHTNKKFHVIVGLFYALLIALSDFLYTLDIGVNEIPGTWHNAALSALQYKHRFYTVVFNLAALALMTLAATVSFKLLDIFLVVFGENFVTQPLIGLLITLALGAVGIIVGIFRPLRGHLLQIEHAMEKVEEGSVPSALEEVPL